MVILGDLNISSLIRATERFNEILQVEENEIVRDAAIQRFEFTYELVWKILRKILIKRGIEANSPKMVFRLAAKDGIIGEIETWFEFVEFRNQTVHVYNIQISKEIYKNLPRFQQLTNNLIKTLKSDQFNS